MKTITDQNATKKQSAINEEASLVLRDRE